MRSNRSASATSSSAVALLERRRLELAEQGVELGERVLRDGLGERLRPPQEDERDGGESGQEEQRIEHEGNSRIRP